MTGIVKKPECTRSDVSQREIQELMEDVFGPDHMGYVEPTGDPFADLESGSEDAGGQSEDSDGDIYNRLFRVRVLREQRY